LLLLGTTNAALTDNLVSYYNFDEASGNLIDQKGNNDGTNTGADYGYDGIIIDSYNFNGTSDYVEIADSAELDLSGNFAIGGWFKVEGNGGGSVPGSAISKWWDGTTRAFDLRINQASISFDWRPSGAGADSIVEKTGLSLNNGSFHYIAIVYADTKMIIYLDGTNVAETTASSINQNNANIRLGAYSHTSSTGFFDGRVDELGFWDRTLTSDEITELYNSGDGSTYPFIESVNANFGYVIDKTNAQVILTDTSTTFGAISITSWSWKINDSIVSTDQNFSYNTTQLQDINACLTIDNNDDTFTDTKCVLFNTGDWTPPETSFSSSQVTGTTNQEIILTCTDNIACKSINYKINEEDWNNYTIGDNPLEIIYEGAGDHNIQYYSTDNADNNETTKTSQFPIIRSTTDQTNSRIQLLSIPKYNNEIITTWKWIINGTDLTGTTDQNRYFYTNANLDLNACATLNSTYTNCQSVTTWDTVNPTIDINISNTSFGFVNNFSIDWNMACYDNFTPVNYKITWLNDGTTTTLYNSNDANASVYGSSLDLNQGQAAKLTFTCTDDYGNNAIYTSSSLYAASFSLINENTGVKLTWTDLNREFTIVKVYTLDGNYSYDFNATVTSDVNFFSPEQDLWFEFGYTDGTKINRQINFSILEDQSIRVCAPFYQTFYQQRFVANSAKTIIVKNNVSDCYIIAGTLAYVYDTGYSITTYTIPKPYYLYTYSNGIKTYLALLDGGVPTAYNIDAIEFSRSTFTLAVGQDTVAFQPVLSTGGIYDTNTIQIYYSAYLQNNDNLKMQIYNGTTLLWEYTEHESPNEILVNYYWGTNDINADTVLELRLTKTVDGENTVISFYFNSMGTAYQNNVSNAWAAIVAVIFFLFGITLVRVNAVFGIFGIIVGIISLFLVSLATGAWWINLLAGAFIILILYIVLMTKQTGGSFA